MSETHVVTKRAINYSADGSKSKRLSVGTEFSPNDAVAPALEKAGLIEKIGGKKKSKALKNKDAGAAPENKSND